MLAFSSKISTIFTLFLRTDRGHRGNSTYEYHNTRLSTFTSAPLYRSLRSGRRYSHLHAKSTVFANRRIICSYVDHEASRRKNMPTDSMKRKTLYRRQLPPPCIGFSSPDGRKLFREALLEGNMEMYFRLAEQFRTQDDPAFCGLSTLTMVLNALAVDPGRVWKGPWRWYHESMLDCCAPLETVREKGVTFDTMVCLARCNGLEVERGGPKTHSLEDLRAVISECSSKDDGKVIVVSYDRKGLKQTGSGHFSPIGGYNKAQDLVLILDTARFKLPPHWVPLELLWEAMKSLDKVTGRPRGFMVLKKSHNLTHRLFTANKDIYEEWPQVASWVKETIELASVRRDDLSRADPDSGKEFRAAATMADFIEPLLERMSPQAASLLTTLNNTMADPLCQTGKAQDGVILQAIQGTDAYQEVKKFTLKSGGRFRSSSSGSEEELIMSTLTSPVCPEESECGCSSRHSIAIMTYALLYMLHKRDFGENCDAGDSKEVVGGHLWREDPVGNLPPNVVEEAMHVAGMLTGLVNMKTA